MAVFCQKCGIGLPATARFCSGCGATVPPPPTMPSRPLVRPRVGRQIAGVCLALAQSNGWDVSAVRILTVIAFLFSSGLVGVAYLAAWIGIPDEAVNLPGAYPPRI
jgi:phage shock protein C